MKRLLLISFLLFTGFQAFGQSLPFRTYSIENGLSEAVVYDLEQDDEGYLWIATGYGLNRFDGFTFQNYYEEDGLQDNRINTVYEDSRGLVWVGTVNGLNVVRDDSVFAMPEFDAVGQSSILKIFEDSSGDFWIATDGQGVWHFEENSNPTQYLSIHGLGSNRVRDIIEDPEGTLWFATRGGLTSLDDGNFRTFTTADGLLDDRLRDLALDENNRLWIATRGGLNLKQGDQFQSYTEEDGLVNNLIQSISADSQDGLWIGTEQGASYFKNNAFRNYTDDLGLPNNIIYSTMIDREDNIWFGTFGGGFSVFFGDFIQNFTVEEGLPNNVVTSITQDQQGAHWITTYGGGITRFDGNSFQNISTLDGLVDDKVYTATVDDQNRLLIGTRWGISIYIDGDFINYNEEELQSRKIRDITQHSNLKEYWIATYENGAFRFLDGEIERFTQEDGLASNTVLSVIEGDDGSFWFATYGGVSHLKDGTFTNYTTREGLPNNGVLDILKDSNGSIWVSTFNGIARFNGEDGFTSITTDDGLPDEVAYFIVQDDSGFFWIGTKEGVARFDYRRYISAPHHRKSDAFTMYTQDQGLVANEMNAGAVFKDRDGNLWLGSVGGVSRLNPQLVHRNRTPPKIHIENVQISGESTRPVDGLEVASDNHNVRFEYIGISFSAPSQVVYEYRLRGSGEGWQQTSDRFVRYPSLPSGEYTFEIRAKNSDGIWTSELTALNFSVSAPFWMQWWFIALVLAVIVGTFLFIYNYYRVKKMVDIERMRVRIASDLHDDVGSTLTEIALQSDFLQTTDLDRSFKESLNQIGKQSRKIVSSLDDIVWSIDARNDTLGDLTDRMQDYINNVLPHKEVSYQFEDINMAEKLTVSMKENLYLIFKEAINNIAKHSNASKVEVVLKNENGTFDLYIHDNGKGTVPEKKTGHGLRNMKMRAKRINADISFENKDGFTVHVSGNDM